MKQQRVIETLTEFTIDFAKKEKVKKSLSFFRGLVTGVGFTSMIFTTGYTVGIFLAMSNLILISYGLEGASKTLSEKARPTKVHFL